MSLASLLKDKEAHVYTAAAADSAPAAVDLMNRKKVGALVVVSQSGATEGIVTERDVLRALSSHSGSITGLKVSDIMTHKEKLITASSSEKVEKVMDVMTRNRMRHLPVLDEGKLVGIVSIGDVVKDRLNHALVENESMRNYIAGS